MISIMSWELSNISLTLQYSMYTQITELTQWHAVSYTTPYWPAHRSPHISQLCDYNRQVLTEKAPCMAILRFGNIPML